MTGTALEFISRSMGSDEDRIQEAEEGWIHVENWLD